jgi:hypothetical protein
MTRWVPERRDWARSRRRAGDDGAGRFASDEGSRSGCVQYRSEAQGAARTCPPSAPSRRQAGRRRTPDVADCRYAMNMRPGVGRIGCDSVQGW